MLRDTILYLWPFSDHVPSVGSRSAYLGEAVSIDLSIIYSKAFFFLNNII